MKVRKNQMDSVAKAHALGILSFTVNYQRKQRKDWNAFENEN